MIIKLFSAAISLLIDDNYYIHISLPDDYLFLKKSQFNLM